MAASTTCPACGSDEVGRGRSRAGWHRLIRDLTPFRRYRCRACGAEGWTSRQLPRSHHPAEQARGRSRHSQLGRPVEHRDLAARRRGLLRAIVTVAAALLLGALAAHRVVSCQGAGASASSE